MAPTSFERPINRWAKYDRDFFENLFKELALCDFDEVCVLVPSDDPDDPARLEPSTFLNFEKPIRGVIVYAKSKKKPESLEILWAYRDPTEMFPSANWPKRRFGMGVVRVVSNDAPRPYALSGHFATFCREHSSRFFLAQPLWGVLILTATAAHVTQWIAERHASWQHIIFTLVSVLGVWLFFTLPRGILVGPPDKARRPNFWLLSTFRGAQRLS